MSGDDIDPEWAKIALTLRHQMLDLCRGCDSSACIQALVEVLLYIIVSEARDPEKTARKVGSHLIENLEAVRAVITREAKP
jgi:hypothetical protein